MFKLLGKWLLGLGLLGGLLGLAACARPAEVVTTAPALAVVVVTEAPVRGLPATQAPIHVTVAVRTEAVATALPAATRAVGSTPVNWQAIEARRQEAAALVVEAPVLAGVGAPAQVGTPLAASGEPIGLGNLARLAPAAVWGKGQLRAVAFAPDGRTFAAGSAFGVALYDRADPQAPPHWVPFEPPVFYDGLAFSADGAFLRLERAWGAAEVRRLADGLPAPNDAASTWLAASQWASDRYSTVASPEGGFRLTWNTALAYGDGPAFAATVYVTRTVHAGGTGQPLYTLTDPVPPLTFDDRSSPQGCDLSWWGPCGNAFEPIPLEPARAAWAADGQTFSILYQAPYGYGGPGLLRTYATADGALLNALGTFAAPVESFAYAPDGRTLLVGYTDGAVTLWDVASEAMHFGAAHFNGPIVDLDWSPDSALMLVQTPGRLDIRRALDGALWGRLAASAFAVSPVENAVALGAADGGLRRLNLTTGAVEYDLSAHSRRIFALAFSPDGQLLATSGEDCRVRTWAAGSGAYQRDFEKRRTVPYAEYMDTASRVFTRALAFTGDGRQLVGYGSWSRVESWEAGTGAAQYLIEPEPLEYWSGMRTLQPHFPEFFYMDAGARTLQVDSAQYALDTGARVGAYQPPATLARDCAAFGPVSGDGALQFTAGYDSRAGQVCVLDPADQHLLGLLPVVAAGDYTPAVVWPYLSPDGTQLAVTVDGGAVYVYAVAP